MRKRERENPCGICEHYHRYEEGEACGVCGHRLKSAEGEGFTATRESAFPTEVLQDFLFLGSYDNASRSEILKTLRISHILDTVPASQNLCKSAFIYHNLERDKPLDFDEANQFLEKCERERSRVLVYCMFGKNRSAAFVAAYLMKSRGWRLAQCLQWVKERRPQVQLTEDVHNDLLEYDQKLFGPSAESWVPTEAFASLGFGFPKPGGDIQVPTFNQVPLPTVLNRVSPNNVSSNFTFGAGSTGVNRPENNSNGAQESTQLQPIA